MGSMRVAPKKIKQAMREFGYKTDYSLAMDCMLSQATIRRAIRGGELKLTTAMKIAQVLGYPVEELWKLME